MQVALKFLKLENYLFIYRMYFELFSLLRSRVYLVTLRSSIHTMYET